VAETTKDGTGGKKKEEIKEGLKNQKIKRNIKKSKESSLQGQSDSEFFCVCACICQSGNKIKGGEPENHENERKKRGGARVERWNQSEQIAELVD
jgi:hypothetical protein